MDSQEAEDIFKLLDSINFSFRNALLIFSCIFSFFVWLVHISFSRFLAEIDPSA